MHLDRRLRNPARLRDRCATAKIGATVRQDDSLL